MHRAGQFHVRDCHVCPVCPMYSIPSSPPPRTTCQGHAASGTRARDSHFPPPAPLHASWTPGSPHLPPPSPTLPISRTRPNPTASRTPPLRPSYPPKTLPPRSTPRRSPDPAPHARSSGLSIRPPPSPRGGRTHSRSEWEDPPPPCCGWRRGALAYPPQAGEPGQRVPSEDAPGAAAARPKGRSCPPRDERRVG